MPITDRASLSADRSVQWAGHLLFLVLTTVGTIRTVAADPAAFAPAVTGAVLITGWYLVGAALLARADRRMIPAWIVVLVAAWAGLTLLFPDFVWLAFVLSMLAWHFLPRPAAVPAELFIAGLAVFAAVKEAPAGPGAVVGPVIGIATAVAVTEAVHRVVDAAEARATLSHELLQTQQLLAAQERQAEVLAERQRLGGEIHDGAGQALAGIVMLLQSATAAGGGDPVRQRDQTLTALDMATTALGDTRGFLRGLVDRADASDLTEALQGVVDQTIRLGLPVDLHVHGIPGLDQAGRETLVRSAQEALANTARHANASKAVVTVTALDDVVHLDVVDDGQGFDPADAGTGTGFGLEALRSRVEDFAGTMTVDSTPGDGTTVHVSLPTATGELR